MMPGPQSQPFRPLLCFQPMQQTVPFAQCQPPSKHSSTSHPVSFLDTTGASLAYMQTPSKYTGEFMSLGAVLTQWEWWISTPVSGLPVRQLLETLCTSQCGPLWNQVSMAHDNGLSVLASLFLHSCILAKPLPPEALSLSLLLGNPN